MNPKHFLTLGGAVLVVVGVLGYVGVIGPTPERSLFGNFWWFDNIENLAHTVLGAAGLAAAFVFPANLQRLLAYALAALALVVGVYNLMGSVQLFGANLESPADLVLHLVVGAWALYAVMNKKG